MKILLLGKNGQVGWELQRSLALYGEVLALGREDENGNCGDLEKPEKLLETIERFQPNIIFNAAAYTAVDKAEEDRDRAMLVNATSVGRIADKCTELGCLLVHYSTDYVFDGLGSEAHLENDLAVPINYYGLTKLNGEKEIITSGCRYLIFRTSWVYGVHGNNFIKTMLRLAKEKTSLRVVADQVGTPTSAEVIADISVYAAMKVLAGEKGLQGVYHLVPDGVTNWCEFARWIIDRSINISGNMLSSRDILAITSEEYPTPARRPLNSRLNNSKLKSILPSNTIKTWDMYAQRVLSILQS